VDKSSKRLDWIGSDLVYLQNAGRLDSLEPRKKRHIASTLIYLRSISIFPLIFHRARPFYPSTPRPLPVPGPRFTASRLDPIWPARSPLLCVDPIPSCPLRTRARAFVCGLLCGCAHTCVACGPARVWRTCVRRGSLLVFLLDEPILPVDSVHASPQLALNTWSRIIYAF
jgi:hypothetical protein